MLTLSWGSSSCGPPWGHEGTCQHTGRLSPLPSSQSWCSGPWCHLHRVPSRTLMPSVDQAAVSWSTWATREGCNEPPERDVTIFKQQVSHGAIFNYTINNLLYHHLWNISTLHTYTLQFTMLHASKSIIDIIAYRIPTIISMVAALMKFLWQKDCSQPSVLALCHACTHTYNTI